ncbi:MAG: hypothetical protein WCJ56_07055 [bacterium]
MFRRILIALAVIAALLVSMNAAIRSWTIDDAFVLAGKSSLKDNAIVSKIATDNANTAEQAYPFVWQKSQREHLYALLTRPEQTPMGTDEVSAAQFALFAATKGGEEDFREGIRREPNNALYHYLLADMYIKQGTKELVKGPDDISYKFDILDRQKLDWGMQELVIGSQLPFLSHGEVLLRAKLAALPPKRSYSDRLVETSVFASVLYPEYSKIRPFARVNGFYLATLLAEGKRTEAEQYLNIGERLVVQVANDTPMSLIGMLVAKYISDVSAKYDALVCRNYGLDDEASKIEAHHKILMGKIIEWKDTMHNEQGRKNDELVAKHGGMMAVAFIPVLAVQQAGVITEESLTPSRLTEYVSVEGAEAAGLTIFAFLLLLYAGLKYWRWKIVMRSGEVQATEVNFSIRDWLRIVGFGLVMPLVLYLIFIATPALSLRDQGLTPPFKLPFFIGIGIFTLWTLIVPTTVAAGILQQKSNSIDPMADIPTWRKRFTRFGIAILTVIWCTLAAGLIMVPVTTLLLMPIIAHSPLKANLLVAILCLSGVILLLIPLLPALWKRKHPEEVLVKLALARSMITIYAVMTIFFAMLVPVCHAFEQHYVQADTLMAPMRQGDDYCITTAEGRTCIYLRQTVRDGATELGIPWK